MANETEFETMAGLGNTHSSEALPGALPKNQNLPRKVPYNLYPEQINGTVFTAKRAINEKAWLYRVRPSVAGRSDFEPIEQGRLTNDFAKCIASPELMRWRPVSIPETPTDFVQGLSTVAGAGDVEARDGLAIHVYAANASMTNRALYNCDGDLLIAPELNPIHIQTEMGWLRVSPGQFAVVQRGIKFRVELPEGHSRGFVLEVYSGHFRLPELGPIGINGLANPRHFEVPVASYEEVAPEGGYEIVTKFGGRLFSARATYSPFDVVAWYGNYIPYTYDLKRFNAMGTVTYDHVDPSILTVLTVPRDNEGNAVADVLFFVGRWDVAENTFRPPYHHRNAAVEFSCIVRGLSTSGYDQGVYSVSPGMTAHGISADTYYGALDMDDEEAEKPQRISDESLWMMVESVFVLRYTDWAMNGDNRERDFRRIHEGYHSRFNGTDE